MQHKNYIGIVLVKYACMMITKPNKQAANGNE